MCGGGLKDLIQKIEEFIKFIIVSENIENTSIDNVNKLATTAKTFHNNTIKVVINDNDNIEETKFT